MGPDKCACPYGFTGDRCQQGNMTSNAAFLCFRFHFSLVVTAFLDLKSK